MVATVVDGVAVRGLVTAVPARQEGLAELAARFGADAARRIAEATGIEARHLARPDQCLSDLALPAARRALDALGWSGADIGALIVVTQTRDHLLPGDAALLHQRLGLPRDAVAFDITLGCSGHVQGLWTLATLMRGADIQRALLVAGDVTSRALDPDDRTVAPLFGDAAAVTALELDDTATPMAFALGSDGAGAPYLMARGGGFRHPDEAPRLFMDGTQVFAFTLREVPGNIRRALTLAGRSIGEVDLVIPHQANRQMLERLARKIGAAPERVVMAMRDFGNTSSASIPLAMTTAVPVALTERRNTCLLSGFGVGWSWGTAILDVGPLVVCENLVVA